MRFAPRVAIHLVTLHFLALGGVATAETVAHWRLVTTKPTLENPVVQDVSQRGLHGKMVGSPKTREVLFPIDGRPVIFDGHDNRLVIPDSPAFQLTEGFTIEAYICIDRYPSRAAELGHIIFRGDDRLGADPWFLAVNSDGHLRFLIASDANVASVVLSPDPIPMGKLVHIAATLKHKNGRQSLYINHEKVASTKTEIRAAGPLTGSNPGVGIGNRFLHSNQAFAGTIHDVKISDESLKPSQFQPATIDLAEKKRAQTDAPAGPKPTTVNGLTFFHGVKIGKFQRGSTIDLGQGHHSFIDVRDPLNGQNYTQRGGYEGAARFRVEEDQMLYVAFYGNDWTEGGNASGSWQHEVATVEQVKAMGWQPMGELRVQHSNPDYAEQPSWVVYSRQCRAGESFVLRNHKYQAPLVFFGTKPVGQVFYLSD